MRAIEVVTAKGETSALCQSIGVSRASLYRRPRPTPPAILDLRHRTRLVAYAAHPERFVSGPPRPETLPTAVWINPPSKTTRQDAPGPTTGTPDDSQHAVVARPRPPLDRSSLHRVDGVESLQ